MVNMLKIDKINIKRDLCINSLKLFKVNSINSNSNLSPTLSISLIQIFLNRNHFSEYKY